VELLKRVPSWQTIATAPHIDTYSRDNLRRDTGMFLLLVVGAGRIARGEAISGQWMVFTYVRLHRVLISCVTPNPK